MSFFYDLNKKLDGIRATPEVTHQQLNERDMGKHNNGKTTGFKAVADKAAKEYGSKAAGERVAGAQFQKMKKAGQLEEGPLDAVKKIGKKVASGVNKLVGHGSDEEMIKDLQRKSGAPVTGKKPTPPQQVKEKLSPAKQKSFAALAPPTDKITFADKIAGAKKEVDEMLGDVAAEAMRKALGGGKGRNAEMEEGSEENAFTAHKRPPVVQPKVGSTEHGHKHDIKHTATGRIVTRRTDPQGISVGADDDTASSGEKRGPGRPKGPAKAPERVTGKATKHKGSRKTNEGEVDVTDQGEYDQEGDMAKNDIKTIVRHAQALHKVLGDNDNLPEWVQSKLAKIEGMMISVDEYMQNQAGDEEAIAEEPKSKNQAVAARIARGVQKGTAKAKPGSASAEMAKMQPKELNKFAKGSTKGLPKKVSKKKEEEVEESTTSGAVATSTAAPKSGGSMSFGKGIYDSMNFELEQMIAESMQNEDAPRSWQRAADKVGTIGGAALGGAGGAAAGALMGTSVFGPLGIAAAGVGGLAGLTGGAALGGKLAKSAVNTAHDAGVGLYRKISSMLGGPEGTIAFAKAHISAAASGQDSFEFGGKNYNVTMNRNEARQLEQNLGYSTRSQYDQLGYPIRKGVPLNRGLTRESMSINMSDSTEGNKSLTVTATDDDAMKLAMILKSAGIGGGDTHGDHMHSHEETCPTCGMEDCGCGDVQEAVDENAPDWPTNTEQADSNFGYSGGLNKPKTDVAGAGQTTVPNTNVHTQDEDALRRMMEMAGIKQAELEPWKETMKEDAEEDAEDAENAVNDAEAAEDEIQESFAESIQRMREIAGIQEAKKPDFPDLDDDGNEKETIEKALKDKEEKKVDESIFALTNQWKAYKG